MKKVIYLLLISMLCITFVSCKKKVYKIQFEAEENVKFDFNKVIELKKNGKIKDALKDALPIKPGYAFLGWSLDGKEIITDEVIKSNIKLIALFEKKAYTLTYKVNSKVHKSIQVLVDDPIEAIEDPSLSGYKFIKWDPLLPTTMPSHDLTVNAVFEKIPVISKINYDLDGGICTKLINTYTEGIGLSELPIPTKEGYLFKGWELENEIVDKIYATQTGEITLKAVWEEVVVRSSISFDLDGGSCKNLPTEYTEGIGLETLPTPTKDGFNFVGWKLNDNFVSSISSSLKGNLTLKAVWEEVDDGNYSITYVYEEGNLPKHAATSFEEFSNTFWNELHAWSGSTLTLEAFKKANLDKWSSGSALSGSAIYKANGELSIDEGYFVHASANRDKWLNWMTTFDSLITDINSGQNAWSSTFTGYVRLYAFFEQKQSYVTETRLRTFYSSLLIDDELKTSYKIGDSFELLPLSLEDGRTFLGWYSNDVLVEAITSDMKGDLVLVAKWTDPVFPESLTLTNPVSSLDKGTTYELLFSMTPSNITHPELIITSSEPKVAKIDGHKLITNGYGTTTITITSKYNPSLSVSFALEVFPPLDETKPVIYLPFNELDRFVINIGDSYNFLSNVLAYDKTDGDISSSVTVDLNDLDDETEGRYTVIYSVVDNNGNSATYSREVVVVDRRELIFIGHAGCYQGIMNTEEAFINAVTVKGYKALECDVKQTKDGVFVVCHDNDFAGVSLASTNWEDLKDVTNTVTRGGIKYTSKICTFKRYLEICYEYGVYAVVELKSSAGITNSDQSRMSALMKEINDAGMLDRTIFLGSQYGCLEWVKKNGYSYIPCQYLVDSLDSESAYNRCLTWGFDISFNIAKTNTQTWIDRYHQAGIKVACYTFNQYSSVSDLQKWINMGVDYVTCDVLTEEDVELPDKPGIPSLPTYSVVFKDFDGTVIKNAIAKEGKAAIPPIDPIRSGYRFVGWDKSFSCVNNDLEVFAVYEIEEYSITYKANFVSIIEQTWSSKEDFINELYTDLFEWLTSNIDNIPELTLSGGVYSLTKNGSTATFSNVSELRALGVAVFEKTVGTFMMKPFETNSPDYEIEEDEAHFFNSQKYRVKYKGMNAYLLNCMTIAYPKYSKGYKPTSDGRVQIFYRFHQWTLGTKISTLDAYPKKYVVSSEESSSVVLPTSPISYNINDNFVLTNASCEGYTFVGWFLDVECTKQITSINGSLAKDLTLYAKWSKN